MRPASRPSSTESARAHQPRARQHRSTSKRSATRRSTSRARGASRCTSSAPSSRSYGSRAARSTSTAGERIHTENSYKYSIAQFQELARSASWAPNRVWTDPQQQFSVHELISDRPARVAGIRLCRDAHLALGFREKRVQRRDDLRTFADGGCDTLDRAGTDVADGEQPVHIRLQRSCVALCPSRRSLSGRASRRRRRASRCWGRHR